MSSVRGPEIAGNFSRSAQDDRARFVDAQGRLRDVGEALRVGDLECIDVLLALHEHDVVGRLAHRALDLLVALVADHHDRVVLGGELLRLDVDLGDQRTGRVDHVELARGGVLVHARRDAMGREDGRRALGHLALGLDEDRPALTQLRDDVLVVHDLLAHVHGRAVELQRALDGLHSAIDTCAVAAWRGEQQLLRGVSHPGAQFSPCRRMRLPARYWVRLPASTGSGRRTLCD